MLLLVGSVGFLWAVFVPEFEKPDEMHHLAYVQYVYMKRSIPIQGASNDPLLEPETQQPPAYYFVAATIYRLARGIGFEPAQLQPWLERIEPDKKSPNHWTHVSSPPYSLPWDVVALRLVGVVLGSTAAVTIYLASCIAASNSSAFLGTMLVGLLPGYTYMASSVTNDPLAWMWGGILIYMLLAQSDPGKITAIQAGILGSLLGLGVYIKATLYTLAVPVALGVISRDPRANARNLAACALCATAISMWWFARNIDLYHDLLGRQELIRPDLYAWNLDPKPLLSSYFLRPFWQNLFESFVGRFGWMRIRLPVWQYLLWLALGGILTAGAFASVRENIRGNSLAVATGRRVALCLSAIVAAIAGVIHYNLTVTQPQGRYLYHVLPAIAVCLAVGLDWWRRWFSERVVCPYRARVALSAAVLCVMLTWNLWCLFAVVGPAHELGG